MEMSFSSIGKTGHRAVRNPWEEAAVGIIMPGNYTPLGSRDQIILLPNYTL